MVGRLIAYPVLVGPSKRCQIKVHRFFKAAKVPSSTTKRLLSARCCAIPAITISTNFGTRRVQHSQSQSVFSAPERHDATDFAPLYQNSASSENNVNPEPHPPSNGREIILDEAYIRRTNYVPTNSEYPEIPDDLNGNPKAAILQAPSGMFKLNKIEFSGGDERGMFRCNVYVDVLYGEQVLGNGEGVQKKTAQRAAYLHVVAQLHKTGALKLAYTKSSPAITHHGNHSEQALESGREAKYDVFDYAARFVSTPRFSHEVGTPSPMQGEIIYRTRIELPEREVEVMGVGRSVQDAETAACLKFFKETDRSEQNSRVIRDPLALRLTTVKAFWDWYRLEHRRTELTLDGPSFLGDDGLLKAQVFMDGRPLGEPVRLFGEAGEEDKIELLAFLTAAIALQKQDASLLPRYLNASAREYGKSKRQVSPVDIEIDARSATMMDQAVSRLPAPTPPSQNEDLALFGLGEVGKDNRQRRQQAFGNLALRRTLETFNNNPKLEQLRQKKAELPMNRYRSQVVNVVEENTFSIIVGATGSGKTTQVPQIVLDNAILKDSGTECNIICTQPRRIAATSVARRVANERLEALQRTVGYQVRGDSKPPRQAGSITYCTTGILLRLQRDPDYILDNYSHLIIDEVHERDIPIDFLLAVLKTAVEKRFSEGKSVPKIVIMSATIDTELFANYFKKTLADGRVIQCPKLSVPGRLFPVTQKHFEDVLEILQRNYPEQLDFLYSDPATTDYIDHESRLQDIQPRQDSANPPSELEEATVDDLGTVDELQESDSPSNHRDVSNQEELESIVPLALVAAVVAHLAKTTDEGGILVFLPGLDEILKLDQYLRWEKPFGVHFEQASKFKILMLHSSVSSASQSEVFDTVPDGCRKIILATNIAETSVTIPDVRHVIDTGKLREKRYDQVRRITKLQCTWISKSNSRQRAGRAGRVQDGYYYALFSKARLETMRATGRPELHRSDLQKVCLDIKAQSFNAPIAKFLAQAIEPPQAESVAHAIRSLQNLEALTEEEDLTPLGRILAYLPVHPTLGKMIVLGVVFRCLDAMMILGAAGTERSIFLSPIGQKRESFESRRFFSEGSQSDHVAFLNAYRRMRDIAAQEGYDAAREFGQPRFIHFGAFQSIEASIRETEKILVQAGVIPYTPPSERHNNELGDPALNETSSNVPLIKALLTAGSPANIAAASSPRRLQTESGNPPTLIHPTSIRGLRNKGGDKKLTYNDLFTYSSMQKSADGKDLFLRDVSPIPPLTAALFGAHLRKPPGFEPTHRILHVNDWLPLFVKGVGHAPKTLLQYRKALDELLSRTFQDLFKRRSRENNNIGEGELAEEVGYLADEPLRAWFVDGLVDLLEYDAEKAQRKAEADAEEAAATNSARILASVAKSLGVDLNMDIAAQMSSQGLDTDMNDKLTSRDDGADFLYTVSGDDLNQKQERGGG